MTYDDEMPAYQKHSDTSFDAAESMQELAPAMRLKVEKFIRSCGPLGATDDEVEVALNLRHQTASARRVELWNKNIVKDSGLRRTTRSGRNATVWVCRADGDTTQNTETPRKSAKSNKDAKDLKRFERLLEIVRRWPTNMYSGPSIAEALVRNWEKLKEDDRKEDEDDEEGSDRDGGPGVV